MSGLTPLMNVVGESCYEDVRATPFNYHYYKFFYEDVRANATLMNVVGESCYEESRATPLTTININFSTKMSGLTLLMKVVGESCYEDVRATPLNYH